MREILFRGKRVGEGEWKYGSYVEQYGATQIYPKNVTDEDGFDCYCVEPETVGQYTGLADKNGKKIFEGDVIKCEGENERGMIVFEHCSACFVVQFETFTLKYNCLFGIDLEVVGNVYDNPELIGGTDNGRIY